jgi:hypothetical protein
MSARAAQVERVLGTRKRQIEQAIRVQEWLDEHTQGRTHHGYGVCVKQRRHFCKCEPEDRDWSNFTSAFTCKCGYELVRECFWQDAEWLAQHEHDFEDVLSAGRSGGWLVVVPQPQIEDMWEHEIQEWLERFAAFALDIEDLLRRTCEAYDRGEAPDGSKLEDLLSQADAEARATD